MSTQLLKHIAFHAVCAAVFIFVLNFYILKTELQSAVFWAIGFGTMAGGLAYQQSKRSGS
ncbi:hypothetical protein YH63_019605 [Afipia massiliensis]|uniref:Uncharacterized protein n=1 Tax=Afipia massiliensis TaxID=211460 RepID=A0A4U6BSA7_9BRAD|nr:hypothetical protein [Afipia massiliensis]MBB5050253.1 hypothetical protein [Afipia massiliensis]TKT73452.1 hypothetical protein YH63_019605 [Afipia massiliensis]